MNLHQYPDLARIPTNQEISELYKLVPKGISITNDLNEIINELFTACSEEWISNFLFNQEMSHLTTLTAPWNLKHALTSLASVTCVQPKSSSNNSSSTNGASMGPFDMHCSGEYLFVPSMVIGSTVVGIGVEKSIIKCQGKELYNIDRSLLEGYSHLRYMFDDQTKIMISVHDIPRANIIALDYTKNYGTTRRKRFFVMLKKELFFSAFQSGVYPNFDLICKSIHSAQTGLEYRNCLLCGIQPDRSKHLKDPPDCECVFPVQRAKHPTDFATTCLSMSEHVGVFEGAASSSFCLEGFPVMSGALGSRIIIGGGVDDDLIDKLSKWAISDKLNEITLEPFKTIMPPRTICDKQDDESQHVHEQTDTISGSTLTNSSNLTTSNNSTPDLRTETFSSHRNINIVQDPVTDEHLQSLGINQMPELDTVLDIDLNMDMVDRMELPTGILTEPINAPYSETSGKKSETNIDTNMFDITIYQGEEQLHTTIESMPQIEGMIENIHMNILPDNNETMITPLPARYEREPIPIAPALTRNTDNIDNYESAADASAIVAAREAERVARAERRRQRNREAAQRSNQRRKEGLKQLKSDLEQAHAAVASLREREQSLREENVRLRKRQAGQA